MFSKDELDEWVVGSQKSKVKSQKAEKILEDEDEEEGEAETSASSSTSTNKKQWREYGSAIVHGLHFINKGK